MTSLRWNGKHANRRRQRRTRRPPTEEERQEHVRTHRSFRSWCPHCVSGGVSTQYRRRSTVAAVADCCFLRNAPDEGPILVLVMHGTP